MWPKAQGSLLYRILETISKYIHVGCHVTTKLLMSSIFLFGKYILNPSSSKIVFIICSFASFVLARLPLTRVVPRLGFQSPSVKFPQVGCRRQWRDKPVFSFDLRSYHQKKSAFSSKFLVVAVERYAFVVKSNNVANSRNVNSL